MSQAECRNCTRPSPDGAPLCSDCAHTLEVALVNIGAYAGDLDLIRARQTSYGDRSGSIATSAERPLPVDLRVHPLEWEARNTVVAWVRHISEQRGDHVGYPRNTIPAMCLWLTVNGVEWLRHRDEGPEALDELLDVEHRLRRIVDRPAERWYAGPCDAPDDTTESGTCETDMYVKVGARVVVCPACETEYDVDKRREWLLDAAEDHLATATEIARAVATLANEPITPERVWKWAERGRIEVRAHDDRGRPLYRVGDVMTLVYDAERQAGKRGAARRKAG